MTWGKESGAHPQHAFVEVCIVDIRLFCAIFLNVQCIGGVIMELIHLAVECIGGAMNGDRN